MYEAFPYIFGTVALCLISYGHGYVSGWTKGWYERHELRKWLDI